MSRFIEQNFVPVEAHIKEHPAWFKRFNAVWTPTVIVMDPDGEEQWCLEGYLPKKEFRAQLEMALARLSVMRKEWPGAEKRFAHVYETYGDTSVGPEALYWRNVSQYSQSHEAGPLQNVARELKQRYPHSVWTTKASVWAT